MPTITLAKARPNTVGRRLIGAVAALLLSFVIAPAAHAQWEVNDKTANETLEKINSDTSAAKDVLGNKGEAGNQTINKNLDAINNKLRIGKYDSAKPGPRAANPEQALPAASSTTATLDNGSRCQKVAKPQQDNCQKIVAIENAQYKYMLTMYENTNTRDAMLRQLLQERNDIKEDDPQQYGKLEDNTNKLTALYNLIALDQQQMQTVNYAYEANLRYLRASQAQLSHSAETGDGPGGAGSISLPIIGDVNLTAALNALATGVVLKGVLSAAKSNPPPGMKTLSIGKSNGW